MATTINAGRVAMVPKGTWSSSTAYSRLDVVQYNGSSYVAIQDSTGQNPSTATTYWQLLAGGVDSSNYYTKTETNTKLAGKQNTLVSGTNIKTINGESLLGSGVITTVQVYPVEFTYLPNQGYYNCDMDLDELGGAYDDHMVIMGTVVNEPDKGVFFLSAFDTDSDAYCFTSTGISTNTRYTFTWRGTSDYAYDLITTPLQEAMGTAQSIPQGGMLPNVLYQLGTTDSVVVSLAMVADPTNVWMFTFTAQSSACSVTLPQGVSLGNEYAWDMVADRYFEITIMNNVAVVVYCDPTSNS